MGHVVKYEPIPLRYSGYYDFQALYDASYAYLRGHQCKIFEKLYKDKVSGNGVREVTIKLYGEAKRDEYRRQVFEIELRCWDHCERVVEGKKMCHGRLMITLTGRMDLDYGDMYTGKQRNGVSEGMKSFLGKIGLINYYAEKVDKDYTQEKVMRDDLVAFQTQCKRILGMQST